MVTIIVLCVFESNAICFYDFYYPLAAAHPLIKCTFEEIKAQMSRSLHIQTYADALRMFDANSCADYSLRIAPPNRGWRTEIDDWSVRLSNHIVLASASNNLASKLNQSPNQLPQFIYRWRKNVMFLYTNTHPQTHCTHTTRTHIYEYIELW